MPNPTVKQLKFGADGNEQIYDIRDADAQNRIDTANSQITTLETTVGIGSDDPDADNIINNLAKVQNQLEDYLGTSTIHSLLDAIDSINTKIGTFYPQTIGAANLTAAIAALKSLVGNGANIEETDLTAAIVAIKTALDELTEEVATNTINIGDRTGRSEDITEEISQLSNDVYFAIDHLEQTIQRKIDNVETNIDSIEGDISEIQNALSSADIAIDALSSDEQHVIANIKDIIDQKSLEFGRNGNFFIVINGLSWTSEETQIAYRLIKRICSQTSVAAVISAGNLFRLQQDNTDLTPAQRKRDASNVISKFSNFSKPFLNSLSATDTDLTTDSEDSNWYNVAYAVLQKHMEQKGIKYLSNTHSHFYYDIPNTKTRLLFLETEHSDRYTFDPTDTTENLATWMSQTPSGYYIIAVAPTIIDPNATALTPTVFTTTGDAINQGLDYDRMMLCLTDHTSYLETHFTNGAPVLCIPHCIDATSTYTTYNDNVLFSIVGINYASTPYPKLYRYNIVRSLEHSAMAPSPTPNYETTISIVAAHHLPS